MFEDRSKTGYSFKKLDAIARTKVETIEKNETESVAHKKLFGKVEKPTQEEVKRSFKQEILNAKNEQDSQIIKHAPTDSSIENLPSSAYLKSFGNQIAEEVEQEEIYQEPVKEQETKSLIDFNSLIESSNSVKVDNKIIKKELKKEVPKPKKNYSFRIKLLSGVYCIIVALFGGWVISNIVNINQTGASLTEITTQTSEVNNNILSIMSKLKELDNATGNPEDESITVKIITQEIDITPEAIVQPNTYEKSSNWFDVLCNWFGSLFGG